MPQVLGMMVELEEDPDWAVADEIDDEDNDRYVTTIMSLDPFLPSSLVIRETTAHYGSCRCYRNNKI